MDTKTYTDFDEFREINSSLDGQWMICGKKDFYWKAETLTLGNSLMMRCHSGTGLITEGTAFNDFYQFYVPMANGWSNNGVPFGQDEVLILEPGVEYHVTTKIPEGYHGIFIPKDMLTLPEDYKKQVRDSYTVKAGAIPDKIRCLFQQYIRAVQENPSIEFSPAVPMLESKISSLLQPLLVRNDNHLKTIGRNRLSRKEKMQKMHEVMAQLGGEPLQVNQLAKQVGISERTLLSIFKEYYKIGPCEYLQLRQLHQIHRDLISANPEQTTVTDVITRQGVWELGRFSIRYKCQFGESPKQTLYRHR